MEGLASHFLFFIGLTAAAAAFALLEIQVEGPNGWAANLPTWRIPSIGVGRWIAKLFPGRPLTGYHLWMLVFMVIVVHLQFAFGLPWSWAGEMRAIAFFLLFWVAEDFLWFVLNPHFGIRRFRPEHIPWHSRAWWWVAPRDYWIATVIGLALYAASRQNNEVIVLAARTVSHGG
ncbi:MAG: hypothetical protein JNG88_16285 [Phycisphaerales bacterium]|nr:hypothetical protein [Phycisphaerales bacterium]